MSTPDVTQYIRIARSRQMFSLKHWVSISGDVSCEFQLNMLELSPLTRSKPTLRNVRDPSLLKFENDQ